MKTYDVVVIEYDSNGKSMGGSRFIVNQQTDHRPGVVIGKRNETTTIETLTAAFKNVLAPGAVKLSDVWTDEERQRGYNFS